MGYQLVFWQQDPKASLVAQSVYESLMDENPVPGLNEFPVETVVRELVAAFPAAIRHDSPEGTTFLELDEERGVLEVSSSRYHILVECRDVPDGVINRVIDVAFDHGCPLYDPQTNVRFDAAS